VIVWFDSEMEPVAEGEEKLKAVMAFAGFAATVTVTV
jgi:hypothetical protein